MARRKCPCCGEPYNGKRCKNCCYENFTEEISHGNHAHEGEPLVVRWSAPVKRPQPTITRESDCAPYAGRKKGKNPLFKWIVVAVVVMVSLFSDYAESGETGDFSDWFPDDFVTLPEVSEKSFVLFDDGEVLLTADWEQGEKFANPITVRMHNGTDLTMSAMLDSIYVNGYRMEYASFYCYAEPGESGWGELWLDEEELARCGIADVQQILLKVMLVDGESYGLYGDSGLATLNCAVALGFKQPVDDSGMLLYDADGIRVIFRDIVGSACEDARLEMYLENNTDHVMDINFETVSGNGIPAEVYLFCRLEPEPGPSPPRSFGICRMWELMRWRSLRAWS